MANGDFMQRSGGRREIYFSWKDRAANSAVSTKLKNKYFKRLDEQNYGLEYGDSRNIYIPTLL